MKAACFGGEQEKGSHHFSILLACICYPRHHLLLLTGHHDKLFPLPSLFGGDAFSYLYFGFPWALCFFCICRYTTLTDFPVCFVLLLSYSCEILDGACQFTT